MTLNKSQVEKRALLSSVILWALYALTVFLPLALFAARIHIDQTLNWNHIYGSYLIYTILLVISVASALALKIDHLRFLRVIWVASTILPLALFVTPMGGMLSMLAATYFMSILSFPFCLLSIILVPVLGSVITKITDSFIVAPAITWFILFAGGYYQWFVLLPKVRERSKNRKNR